MIGDKKGEEEDDDKLKIHGRDVDDFGGSGIIGGCPRWCSSESGLHGAVMDGENRNRKNRPKVRISVSIEALL